jgi:glycerol-3-phosphate dehydrogenase
MALTVSDVMMRRLHLFHEVRDGAVVAARDVALYMARLLDWITVDIDRQVAAYADEVERNRGALRRGGIASDSK